uniref:(northern house mosquito) hypothetical protein n=1 Tax=Culex pipiens TaxID=7175 RepID=A0A8D8CGU0_CULPI
MPPGNPLRMRSPRNQGPPRQVRRFDQRPARRQSVLHRPPAAAIAPANRRSQRTARRGNSTGKRQLPEDRSQSDGVPNRGRAGEQRNPGLHPVLHGRQDSAEAQKVPPVLHQVPVVGDLPQEARVPAEPGQGAAAVAVGNGRGAQFSDREAPGVQDGTGAEGGVELGKRVVDVLHLNVINMEM